MIKLYLATPLCGIGLLGIMVSNKFEVDHARIFVEIDDKVSEDQKLKNLKEIDELEKSIRNQQAVALTIGIATFFFASGMMINRKKLLKRKTSK